MASVVKYSTSVRRMEFDVKRRKEEVDWRTKQVEWLKPRMRTFYEMRMAAQVQDTKNGVWKTEPGSPDGDGYCIDVDTRHGVGGR